MAFLALRLNQHDPCRLDEHDAQLAIATLGYLAQDSAVAGRDLFGDKPQPSGKVTAFGEPTSRPIAATIALKMIGPTPGTLISGAQRHQKRLQFGAFGECGRARVIEPFLAICRQVLHLGSWSIAAITVQRIAGCRG